MFGDEESFMTDVIGNATNEDAFNVDKGVFNGGPYMGLIHRAMEIVAKNIGYEQQTLDQAYRTMEKVFEALDLTKEFTPIIRIINLENMKFMKVQTNCIKKSPNILPKITRGKSTEFTLSILENDDIFAQIVDKRQGLPNGVNRAYNLKLLRNT